MWGRAWTSCYCTRVGIFWTENAVWYRGGNRFCRFRMRSIGKIRYSKVAFTDLFSTSKAPPSVLCFLVLGKYAANRHLKLETWIVVLYLHDRSTKTTVKSVQKEPEPYFFIINAPGVFRQAPGADFTSLLRIFLKLIRSCLVYIIVQPVAVKRIGHISPA